MPAPLKPLPQTYDDFVKQLIATHPVIVSAMAIAKQFQPAITAGNPLDAAAAEQAVRELCRAVHEHLPD